MSHSALLRLPYGGGVEECEATGWMLEPLLPQKSEPLIDHIATLADALENPTGGKPFNETMKGAKSVAILIPDKTRKAAVKMLLPAILKRLEEAEVPDDGITIIFATGIHPQQTEEEQRSIVGHSIYERYRCVDHNCDDDDNLMEVGELAGELLYLNRAAVEAERLILIGSVKPHYIAGFGGGRKLVMPGVASRSNSVSFHALCLHDERPGRHRHSTYLNLEGNRMHERARDAAHMAGVDFCVNVITDGDGRPLFINGGALDESYLEATEVCRKMAATPLPERRSVVIASCGGYPADLNFIQAHKSLDVACRAVKEAGTVILLAECADGIGNNSFLDWFRRGGPEAIYHGLRERFEINGQTAMSVREKSGSERVILVSALREEDVRLMGMEPAGSLAEAVEMAKMTVPDGAAGWLIPAAGATLPAE